MTRSVNHALAAVAALALSFAMIVPAFIIPVDPAIVLGTLA